MPQFSLSHICVFRESRLEDGLTALLAYTLGVKKLIVAVNKRDSTEENDLGNPNWVVVKDAVLT